MGFAEVWSRTLVYFGIAEEDDWDEDGYATNEDLERSYGARERANVRRLQPRRGRDFDDWTDSEPAAENPAEARPGPRPRGAPAGGRDPGGGAPAPTPPRCGGGAESGCRQGPPDPAAQLQRRTADRGPV